MIHQKITVRHRKGIDTKHKPGYAPWRVPPNAAFRR